jgi:hypothetical protein
MGMPVNSQSRRGRNAKNKDNLRSDRDDTMSAKPAARKDQFGSHHNEDNRKIHQRQLGRPPKGGHDLSFRESAQDLQPDRDGDKTPSDRRRPKSASQKKPRAKR